MPVPDIVQETGTVMLIWSTTEGSSAETVLEARIAPESKLRETSPNGIRLIEFRIFD
jgi:hypothetical protein